ncbi:MAG: hypothetical protein JXB60_07325 [Candidatus Cloacimonetes bacterium]|nr:hypothetical protein [Candidatus Cloacimonadota bacterium]
MDFFPEENWRNSGDIVSGSNYKPATDGPVIYLNGGDNLQIILDRIEAAGGKIIIPKTFVTDNIGYFAFFLDTEGNRLRL